LKLLPCYNFLMISTSIFQDYQLLDAGDKEKLESWNGIILRRPDPMALWPKLKPDIWDSAMAYYHRSNKGGGYWEYKKKLPEAWKVQFQDLTFKVSPTNFKHTGLFPEQAANWEYINKLINNQKDVKVLNLFAYTGGATMAASKAGAEEVVHVDAAKGMIEWAKENRDLSGLTDKKIRFIVDDCLKFMQREIRRGHKYEGIIMDPPSYGRGPDNELFKFEEKIGPLVDCAIELLSDKALFLIINTYTTGYSQTVIANLLRSKFKDKGHIEADEIGIPIIDTDYYLPCGFTTRWTK